MVCGVFYVQSKFSLCPLLFSFLFSSCMPSFSFSLYFLMHVFFSLFSASLPGLSASLHTPTHHALLRMYGTIRRLSSTDRMFLKIHDIQYDTIIGGTLRRCWLAGRYDVRARYGLWIALNMICFRTYKSCA